MTDRRPLAGKVVALWRYPIKPMQGEQVPATTLVNGSLLGDRAFALLDGETGLVASAKHQDRWPCLLGCRCVAASLPSQRDRARLRPAGLSLT